MGVYKFWNPSTSQYEIIKSKSIINADGTNEYTPDEVKAIEDNVGNLSTSVNELATNKNTAKQGQVLISNGDGTATFKEKLLIPPSPINNLIASVGDQSFVLTFDNPSDGNFAGVRLVYKTGSFPKSLTDGVVVEPYNSNQIISGLINATNYYCRLFTYDTDGDYNDSFDEQTVVVIPRAPVIYGVKINTTNSNPQTAVTYTDMASGFTPAFCNNGNWQMGSWANKFPYDQIKPCLLKNGVVNYYLNPNDYTKKSDGSIADITSGNDGDVMVEFPKIYWKFETVGTDLYVRYSDVQIDNGYKCLAHTRGATIKDKVYVSAYMGLNLSSKLRSLSGKTATASTTIGNFRTLAQANGAGYDQMAYYPLLMLQVLALIMGKNRDTQTSLGRGYVDGNAGYATTGNTNTKGLFYGEATGKLQNKFCGIEDFYGSYYYWIDGMFCDGGRNILIGSWSFNDTGSGYSNFGQGSPANLSGYIGAVQGGTETGFIIKSTSGSATTHYSDYGDLDAGYLPIFGGNRSDGSDAGAFRLRVIYSAAVTTAFLSARLCFI